MRKFLLSFALLVAGAMTIGAVTVPETGVYTIEGGVTNEHRGFLVAGENITTHPVLAEIGWSNYAGNSTEAIEGGKNWYVKSAGNDQFFIYNLALKKFIAAGTGSEINFSDAPYLWKIVVNSSNNDYNSIRDTNETTYLCFACGKTGANRPVHFNNQAADGGSMHTFTAVENGETIYATQIEAANEILRPYSYYWPSYAKTVTVGDRITDFSTVEDGQTVVFKIVNHNRYITIGEDCNAKMSAEVTGFNVFKLHRVNETQTFNFESAREGFYFPELKRDGWPTYTMQVTSSPIAFEFLSAKADGTALEEGQFVVKSTTADAYFDGNASSFTGWQGNGANCVYEVYKVSCSEDKYFIGDFDFTVIDDLGNSYTGTTRGALGETPTSLPFTGVVGYTFANEEWTNENTSYTANIKFPFAISNENVTNMTTIASVYDDKKWCATDAGIMVKTSDYDASDNNWLWAIYPQFDNGVFSFKIKSIGQNKWIYTNATGSKVDGTNDNDVADNAAGAVQLSDEGTSFDVVKSNSVVAFHYMVDESNQYLSINSKSDTKVYLGVHTGTHVGTDCHFSLVKTVVEGLAGEGNAANPYLINNVDDLVFFRNSVNAGETTYNAEGVYVALGADIDLAGENWVGIGSATAAHGFMGNFDGKTFKIKNLTITNPTIDSDGYVYAGLFGVTEGTDQNNQNVIKNLTIENVTINTTGHIVSAAIAYPYYTIVDNVNVCGNIAIEGGNYTAGVLAYTRRCVNASNLSIVGNPNSYVTGKQTIGGVISDIQMNGGLKAEYSNFSAEGISVTGTKSVGGISGIIAGQTLNGASVKDVTLNCDDARVGVVAGSLGAASTITGVETENVTGASVIIGATYDYANVIEAKAGDTYYSTLAEAVKGAGNVELLTDVTLKDDVAYASNSSKQVTGKITYTRTLIAGIWNPIYLPFATELSTEEYDVAEFTSAEGTTLTLTKIEGETATLNANTAYVIRPKNEAAKTLTIELTDATLEAATVNTQELGEGFSVKGNYSVLTGSELGANDRVVGTNGDWGVLKSTSTLKPFRLILTIPATASAISMRVEGEDVTSIENLGIAIEGDVIFDLMGRRVETMTEGGIYIVNGKKIVF